MLNVLLVTHPPVIVSSPSGWNELLIASFSHRSINSKDGVLLASELQRDSANSAGVGAIFDRYGWTRSCQNSFTCGEGASGMKALSFVTGRMCRVQKSGPSLTGNLLFLPKALAVLYVIQPSNLLNLSWFRVLTELVNKMRDMQMDKTELGCLRAIVLFNPGARARPIFWPLLPVPARGGG